MNQARPSIDQEHLDRVPSGVLATEMLNAMDDQAMIRVYRLLVSLEQHDAAALLAEFARRVLELDVAQAP